MSNLIKNPFDFLMLYLYERQSGELITTLMKIYQIFTSFIRFQHLNHFKASFYGGEDTSLETAIYSSSNYFQIDFRGENEQIKLIKLDSSIRIKLKNTISKIISDDQAKKDYELIKKLSLLSKNFKQSEIIKFCYHFYPELAEKSTITSEIAKINDNVLRRTFKFFLLNIPTQDTYEFLNQNLSKILDLSLLSLNNKNKVEQIVSTLITNNETNEILLSTKGSFLNLLENVSDLVFKQILRKSINLLIFNENIEFNQEFIINWIEYLLKLEIEYNNGDYKHFMNILKRNDLKHSINTISID